MPEDIDTIAKFPEVEGEKDLWAVWNNTDLTEGRGGMYIQYVCEAKATALRLAKKAGIQGGDADVIQVKAYLIDKNWYYRSRPVPPNDQDRIEEKKLIEAQLLKERREKVLQKAIQLGLSEEDIKVLREIEKN